MGWFKKIFDPSPISTDEEKAALTKSITRLDVAVEVLTEKVLGMQSDSEYNRQAFEKVLDDALHLVKQPAGKKS